jgi:hypothetical protein
MLAPMLPPPPPRFARRLRLALAVAVVLGSGVLVALAGCGPNNIVVWICLNPVTGKEDGTVYDDTHYVNGVADPCHCYDPCGPEKSCPILVDAGPPGPGCDAGDGG